MPLLPWNWTYLGKLSKLSQNSGWCKGSANSSGAAKLTAAVTVERNNPNPPTQGDSCNYILLECRQWLLLCEHIQILLNAIHHYHELHVIMMIIISITWIWWFPKKSKSSAFSTSDDQPEKRTHIGWRNCFDDYCVTHLDKKVSRHWGYTKPCDYD